VGTRSYRVPGAAPTTARATTRPSAGLPAAAVNRFAAGNQAAVTSLREEPSPGQVIVQRESRADALTWLRRLLASRGAALSSRLPAAASRLSGWSTDRQTALLRQVRGAVDGFEVAVGAAGLLADPQARQILGILESAQSNDALGNRLVDVFQTSAQPVLGLVIASRIPEPRLRAVLQTHAQGAVALTALRTRNPIGGVPVSLWLTYGYLTALAGELASPGAAGVTASTPARETGVEAILTPPAVAAARAAAAAAGLPPPAFIPARYYEDLIGGLHQQMLAEFAYYEVWSRRNPMDTRPGGHVEGIATEAKARVDAQFGDYGSRPAPSLSFAAGNLSDRTTIAGDPVDMTRYFVNEGAEASVSNVQAAHNSFEDAVASQAIENRLIDHYSGRSTPTLANERAALAAVGMSTAERQRRLRLIDRMWGGVAQGGNVSIRAREGGTARETRGIYWGLFKTMLHEYLHTTAHPTYTAWYEGLTDSHHVTTYQEGFTDLFTLKAWNSVFPNEIAANRGFRQRIQGTADADFDMSSVGGPPGHYPELVEAEQIEALIGLPNMRAAYFRGNTAVLGGSRLPR
jgi:hypothetical protein